MCLIPFMEIGFQVGTQVGNFGTWWWVLERVPFWGWANHPMEVYRQNLDLLGRRLLTQTAAASQITRSPKCELCVLFQDKFQWWPQLRPLRVKFTPGASSKRGKRFSERAQVAGCRFLRIRHWLSKDDYVNYVNCVSLRFRGPWTKIFMVWNKDTSLLVGGCVIYASWMGWSMLKNKAARVHCLAGWCPPFERRLSCSVRACWLRMISQNSEFKGLCTLLK